MPNKLSQEKIDEMWKAFQERQAADYVSRKCGIHWRTVERYRRMENWDGRLHEIRVQAQQSADYDLAAALAESLKLVRTYKGKLADAIAGKTIVSEEIDAAELDRIVKLESFILGGAETRTETIERFAGWTDQELERYADTGQPPSRTSPRKA